MKIRTKRLDKGTIHCVAQCTVCDWKCGDYRFAQRDAQKHCRNTGHDVIVDVGHVYRITRIVKCKECGWWTYSPVGDLCPECAEKRKEKQE